MAWYYPVCFRWMVHSEKCTASADRSADSFADSTKRLLSENSTEHTPFLRQINVQMKRRHAHVQDILL
jgi:hypothetical protein